MQERYQNRKIYFQEQAETSRTFYLDYVRRHMTITASSRVLEVGCGEGGNLLPFAEMGCSVMGVDIKEEQVERAKEYFLETGHSGTFIASDFMAWAAPATDEERYDLILVHDVIEHIEPPYKQSFVAHLKDFMRPDAHIFFAFPAWQMPFGGHQQICHSRMSRLPYIHLLPVPLYRGFLRINKESDTTIAELLSIKRAKMPVERFERLVRAVGLTVADKTYWFINPHYLKKFGLRPRREVWPFTKGVWLRNFYTTSAWYMCQLPR